MKRTTPLGSGETTNRKADGRRGPRTACRSGTMERERREQWREEQGGLEHPFSGLLNGEEKELEGKWGVGLPVLRAGREVAEAGKGRRRARGVAVPRLHVGWVFHDREEFPAEEEEEEEEANTAHPIVVRECNI